MRTLLMVLMIAGLMSTVGVYAASLGTATISATGATTSQTVSAPNTGAVTVVWTYTSGNVTGANVTWTPTAAKTYSMIVVAGGTTGTFTTPTTVANTVRTDAVPMASTDPASITTAKVTISEN